MTNTVPIGKIARVPGGRRGKNVAPPAVLISLFGPGRTERQAYRA